MVVPGRPVRVTLELSELLAVHHLHAASLLLDPDVAVVREGRRSRAALARGDEHDAIRATRPVDRRRRRVLQDLDRLDVVRVQISDARCWNPVHHVQRIVAGRDRARAAHADPDPVARLLAGGDDVHARHASLDGADGVDRGRAFQIRGRDGRYRARDVPADLGAVADHHDFLQGDGQRLQAEVRGSGLAGCHHHARDLAYLVPDEPGLQPVGAWRDLGDAEPALAIGGSGEGGAQHADPDLRQREAGLLGGHDTSDDAGFRGGRSRLLGHLLGAPHSERQQQAKQYKKGEAWRNGGATALPHRSPGRRRSGFSVHPQAPCPS